MSLASYTRAIDIGDEIDDPELQACLARALPERALSQSVSLQVYDRLGSRNQSSADLFWKHLADGYSRALLRVTEPPARSGMAVLLIERDGREPDIYLYLPELRQARRVTGKTLAGSMLGTDFSYEDFSHFQSIATASETKRLDDRVLDGRPVYVVESIPIEEDSKYSRVLSYIDREQCLPVKTEFFGRNGTLEKELIVSRDHVEELDGRWIPRRVVMFDRMKGSRTELIVDTIEIDPDLRDGLFHPASLKMGR